MSINIVRGNSDGSIAAISKMLDEYQSDHPRAQIDLYRYNAVSNRIRIIDPEFAGKASRTGINSFGVILGRLAEETQSDISSLLLITPDETKDSFANFIFEDPSPSEI